MKQSLAFLKNTFWPKASKSITSLLAQIGLTGAYVVSPIDVVPDFIAGFGFADDFVLLVLCLIQIFILLSSKRQVKETE